MVCLSRPYHLKIFKGYLSQTLLGPFLNKLAQMSFQRKSKPRGIEKKNGKVHNFYESGKLRALRAKNKLTCQSALRAYVLACQRALRAYVLTCQLHCVLTC